MENMIKNKMMETRMELDSIYNRNTPDSGATITDIIWEEGYLNGQLKTLEDLLSIISINKPIEYVKEEYIIQEVG